jgi:tRNA 2-thiouridine synthesizing protein A
MATVVVDVKGETCPIPLIETRKALRKAAEGDVVEVLGTHQASKREIPMAVKNLGLEILDITDSADGEWRIRIRR